MVRRCDADFCTGDCLGCQHETEEDDLLRRFTEELRKPTGDGQRKRSRQEKPPWYIDPSHEAAMYRHLDVYEAGERFDPDSGCHPLVSVAWRALAIACKDTGNVPQHG